MADGNVEPSMEDILSSIKRIIAEDTDVRLSGPRVKRAVGLTPPPPAPKLSAEPSHDESDEDAAEEGSESVLELTEPVAVEPPPVARPVPATAPKAESAPSPLVSATTAEASRSSLSALSALVVKPEVAGSDTLEGLVREMLRPMLSQWLDANLPDIVERQVAREIARIADRG